MNCVYRGIVRGRVVELEPEASIPEGTRVSVIPEGLSTGDVPLRHWLNEARQVRERLPLTSDSVEILQRIRQERVG